MYWSISALATSYFVIRWEHCSLFSQFGRKFLLWILKLLACNLHEVWKVNNITVFIVWKSDNSQIKICVNTIEKWLEFACVCVGIYWIWFFRVISWDVYEILIISGYVGVTHNNSVLYSVLKVKRWPKPISNGLI